MIKKANIQFLVLMLFAAFFISCAPTGSNVDESAYLQPEDSPNLLDSDFEGGVSTPHDLESLRPVSPTNLPEISPPAENNNSNQNSDSEPAQVQPAAPSPQEGEDQEQTEDQSNSIPVEPVGSSENPQPYDDVITGNAWGHCVENSIFSDRVKNTYSFLEVQGFNLALTITGSFEGKDFWANLANNSDNQGVSAGLFQQNLGQGSLQALLVIARDRFPNLFSEHFSSQQEELLLAMLGEWENSSSGSERKELGVKWALENIYQDNKGKKFKPEWESNFKSFLSSNEYIEIQEEAAMAIHQRAMGYMKEFNATKLKTYLFFFDLVVQNGSTRGVTLSAKEMSLSEDERILKLLEKRLTFVRAKYVEDVRDRKMSILKGRGLVHKKQRDYIQDTCVTDWNHAAIVTFN